MLSSWINGASGSVGFIVSRWFIVEVELGHDVRDAFSVVDIPGIGDPAALALLVEGAVELGCEVLLGPVLAGQDAAKEVFVDLDGQLGPDSRGIGGAHSLSLATM
jgi:hypothetical protein